MDMRNPILSNLHQIVQDNREMKLLCWRIQRDIEDGIYKIDLIYTNGERTVIYNAFSSRKSWQNAEKKLLKTLNML